MYKLYKTKADNYLIIGRCRAKSKFVSKGQQNEWFYRYQYETFIIDKNRGFIRDVEWRDSSEIDQAIIDKVFTFLICTDSFPDIMKGIGNIINPPKKPKTSD